MFQWNDNAGSKDQRGDVAPSLSLRVARGFFLLLLLSTAACSTEGGPGGPVETSADQGTAGGEADLSDAGEVAQEDGGSADTPDIEAEDDGGGPVCGDGAVEGDEECDDGNEIDDDLCANDCTWNGAVLCSPCQVDEECGSPEDRCLWLEDGRFCGGDCSVFGCPDGYHCIDLTQDNEVIASQCAPLSGRCGCEDSDGDGVCDTDDLCPGGDDLLDEDGDGLPDDCDCGVDGILCGLNATCVDSECVCNEGYVADGGACVDIDECLDPASCGAGALCENLQGGYSCICPEGTVSPNPYIAACGDIDECLDPNMCAEDALCINEWGSHECVCPEGFESEDPALFPCTDIDECLVDNGGCDLLVDCINIPGSYLCGPCPAGYAGSSEGICIDIDECLFDNGGCDLLTACSNIEGGWFCGPCPEGYGGDGEIGCTDINECLEEADLCDPLTACFNSPGSFYCSACPAGYVGSGEAGCEDIDECLANICDENATCSNLSGGFECICNPGYLGDGLECILRDDPCAPFPPILLYETEGSGVTPLPAHGRNALDRLGCPYTVATSENFVSQLESKIYGLLVFGQQDACDGGDIAGDWATAIADYIVAGGAAVVSSCDAGNESLEEALGAMVSVEAEESYPLLPYVDHPIFTMPYDVTSSSFSPTSEPAYGAWALDSIGGPAGGVPIEYATFGPAETGELEGAAIVRYNFGRTFSNGFLWSSYEGDEDADGIPDMEELVYNQITAATSALAEDFIGLPWDFYDWGEAAAESLYYAVRRGYYYDPVVLAVSECVDISSATSAAAPGGSATGEYEATQRALEYGGFIGETIEATNASDAASEVLNYDVILFMEQERCNPDSAEWQDIVSLHLMNGGRVVGTFGLISDFIDGFGFFGQGLYGYEGTVCTFDRLNPFDPFWGSFPDENMCHNATYGWMWESGGYEPLEVSPADPARSLIWRIEQVSLEGGCRDGSVEEVFQNSMVGCGGSVTFEGRGGLCETGWRTCSAEEWVRGRGSQEPQHHYWTDDDLLWSGVDGNCMASLATGATSCSPDHPMRVCATTSTHFDAEGNYCEMLGCGFESTSPVEYFGGCSTGMTAGSLCCME